MKLEPVGHINAEQLAALIAGNEDQATITSDWKLPSDTPLYAIPEGYVVVPVEQVKDARLLAWLLEKHGEQIRQILWSYDQCCSDEINALGVKAMLTAAAKGE